MKSSGDEKHLPVTTTSIPSLQHNLERQIFVAFEKPAVHVTHVQFFNTLSFTVEKVLILVSSSSISACSVSIYDVNCNGNVC